MRGRRRAWTAALVTAVFAGLVTLPVLSVAAPAVAAPEVTAPARCPATAPAAAAVITGVPWAQERYAPQRLTPLADGRGITVAVIDSGVDARHPQLVGRVVPGTDLLDTGDGTVDCVSHGTAVASVIAAVPVAGVGFRGLAPAARILPVRVSEQLVLDGGASGRTVPAAGLAQAIRYAVTHGATVLNLSVVLYRDDPAVRAAVADALAAGVTVVAAAGNDHAHGDPTPYPAAYDGVIGVGAIGPAGTRVPSSQVGSYVDIVAPGADVTAAARVQGHGVYEGTSFATPFVAATAALVRQYWPGQSADAVATRILATADPAPGGRWSAEYGYGVLNPYRAVTDRIAAGEPDQALPLPVAAVDGDARTAADRRATRQRMALRVAGGGGIAAALILVVALVVPRGVRRRWRPGP